MGFFGKFFVAIFAVCAAGGAWAAGCTGSKQNCADGKYNRYGCAVGGLAPMIGYECVSCPAPFDKSGTTQQTIENCYVEQPCGTGETCALYYGNQSGICQNSTGNQGDYHLELVNNSAVCYSNTQACGDFPNYIETDGTSMSCNAEMQQGQAVWQQNAWYTGNCECRVQNAENTGLLRCERVNMRAYVTRINALVTRSVNNDIVYTLEYMYCAKCHAGYLPNIVTGSNAHYFRPAGGNGNWGVLACGTKVTVPDYAPGCTINFGLATGDDVMADCRGICPTGFETEANGATSISDCVSQYTPEFEDQTGTFVLTSLDSCQ